MIGKVYQKQRVNPRQLNHVLALYDMPQTVVETGFHTPIWDGCLSRPVLHYRVLAGRQR